MDSFLQARRSPQPVEVNQRDWRGKAHIDFQAHKSPGKIARATSCPWSSLARSDLVRVCDEEGVVSIPGGNRKAERTRDRLSLLRNHALFRDLSPPVIEHLGSYMTTRRVARGTTIFAKGDPGSGLMGVLAGTVKVSVASADGKDIVLNLFNEGEVFGEIALLDGRPRTADATAMSDCELVVIERRDFVPFLSSLAKTLLQLTEAEDGFATRRKAAVTQREISQMIGISRESTNKQLRAWAKRGWIRLERGGVGVVAPDKLTAIATESSEFSPS